jgi:hypothetical protein
LFCRFEQRTKGCVDSTGILEARSDVWFKDNHDRTLLEGTMVFASNGV